MARLKAGWHLCNCDKDVCLASAGKTLWLCRWGRLCSPGGDWCASQQDSAAERRSIHSPGCHHCRHSSVRTLPPHFTSICAPTPVFEPRLHCAAQLPPLEKRSTNPSVGCVGCHEVCMVFLAATVHARVFKSTKTTQSHRRNSLRTHSCGSFAMAAA